MYKRTFLICSVDDFRTLCNVARGFDIDIDARYGSYTVDCKSLMGLVTMGVQKPIDVIPHTDDPGLAKELFDGIRAGLGGK